MNFVISLMNRVIFMKQRYNFKIDINNILIKANYE